MQLASQNLEQGEAVPRHVIYVGVTSKEGTNM
jgi:hypothetical protein